MKNKVLTGIAIAVYALFWTGGVFSYVVLGEPPGHMQWAGPVFMALAMGLGLAYSSPRYRVALVCAGVAGFLAELLGVWTGFPFGGYVYTEAFAPLLLGVPLVMVCAWAVLAGYIHALLVPWLRHPVALTAAGALGLTAIDLVLDPVAANIMNLWTWEHAGHYYGIPLSNFVGWFLVSLVVFGVLLLLGRGESVSPKVRLIGLTLVLFFTTIALGRGLLVPAFWGAALCAGHFLLTRRALVPGVPRECGTRSVTGH